MECRLGNALTCDELSGAVLAICSKDIHGSLSRPFVYSEDAKLERIPPMSVVGDNSSEDPLRQKTNILQVP